MKKAMSAAEMKALLIEEFAKLRSPECKTCEVPLPYWGPGPGPGNGYWYMETAVQCPYGCRQRIAELWARLTTEYEISAPPPERIPQS